jgi:large repetitive protein
VDAGNAASLDDLVCLNISGNTSAGSNGALGIGIRKQGTVATTNDFGITGLSPSPATRTQAATFVAGNNPTGGGAEFINGDNFVSCLTAPP